jgi:hypothetical protein
MISWNYEYSYFMNGLGEKEVCPNREDHALSMEEYEALNISRSGGEVIAATVSATNKLYPGLYSDQTVYRFEGGGNLVRVVSIVNRTPLVKNLRGWQTTPDVIKRAKKQEGLHTHHYWLTHDSADQLEELAVEIGFPSRRVDPRIVRLDSSA